MLLKSFEDDKEAMKLDVLLDSRRRHMEVEFNYDEGTAEFNYKYNTV